MPRASVQITGLRPVVMRGGRSLVCLACLLFGLTTFVSLAHSQEPLRFLETCEGREACLRFDLHLPVAQDKWPIARPTGIVGRVAPLDTMYTDYELTLRGRLNGGAQAEYRVWLKAFTDGIACSSFGQAVIPLAGYSKDRNPLVLTDRGELEITDAGPLEMGCADCARLLDPETMAPVYAHATPSWELYLVGLRVDGFGYDNTGNLYVLADDRCVRLATDRRFAVVSRDRCTASEIGHYGKPARGLTLGPAERLYESDTSRYLLLLKAGACT